jgi:hypothetical protein
MNSLNRYDSIIEKLKNSIDQNKQFDNGALLLKKKRDEVDKLEKLLELKRKRSISEKQNLLNELIKKEDEEVSKILILLSFLSFSFLSFSQIISKDLQLLNASIYIETKKFKIGNESDSNSNDSNSFSNSSVIVTKLKKKLHPKTQFIN